jgi:hypothetical protein
MHPRSLVTRRKALLAGAGAIAAPFVVTAPGFGQTGPIKLAGLVSLTGSGSPFGPNSRLAHQAVVDQVNAGAACSAARSNISPRTTRPTPKRAFAPRAS